MKTIRSLTPSDRHGQGGRLADRIGAQVAAVLLAVLVTPSTLPAPDWHSDRPPALDRSAKPPRG